MRATGGSSLMSMRAGRFRPPPAAAGGAPGAGAAGDRGPDGLGVGPVRLACCGAPVAYPALAPPPALVCRPCLVRFDPDAGGEDGADVGEAGRSSGEQRP